MKRIVYGKWHEVENVLYRNKLLGDAGYDCVIVEPINKSEIPSRIIQRQLHDYCSGRINKRKFDNFYNTDKTEFYKLTLCKE